MMNRDDIAMAAEAERYMLSAALMNNRLIHQCVSMLDGVRWSDAGRGAMWAMMVEIAQEGGHVDAMTLTARMSPTVLSAVGGFDGIMAIDAIATLPQNVEAYATIIRELSHKAAFVEMARNGVSGVMGASYADWRVEAASVPGQLINAIDTGRCRVEWIDAQRQFVERAQAMFEKTGLPGLPTGYRDYDRLTGGLQPGTLNVLAARPGIGKTAFACGIAASVATGRNGVDAGPVVYWSGEMPKSQIAGRITLAYARSIRTQAVQRGGLTEDEIDSLLRATRALSTAPIFPLGVEDCTTMAGLYGEVMRITALHGAPSLVVIDQGTLMEPTKPVAGDEWAGLRESSKLGKRMALALSLPVLLLTQVNQKAEDRPACVPAVNDIFGSDRFRQDADSVTILWRARQYDPNADRIFRAMVIKNREGQIGSVEMVDHLDRGFFGDAEWRE